MTQNTAVVLLLLLGASSAQAQATSLLTLQRTIPLPAGTGKFDHFAVDLAANRLFIAATTDHSVEIMELTAGRVTGASPELASLMDWPGSPQPAACMRPTEPRAT